MLKKIPSSVIVYLILFVIIIILRILLLLFPAGQIAPQMVNLTDNLSVTAIWLLGWVGVVLAARTGFTQMWVNEITHFKRFALPALVGVGLGVITILFDLVEPMGNESLIKFPASLVAYPLAGILEEIIFRLFLTTSLVWIISNMLLGGRWQESVFLAVSVFLGVFYTIMQLGLYREVNGSLDLLVVGRFFTVIAADFIIVANLYRRYGFLAAISMRMGDYFVWHIVWGAIAKG